MHRLLCLFLVLPTLAAAQAKGSRTCRILYLGAPDNAPEKLHLFDGTASQEVELPQMNLSPIYQLPSGPMELTMLSTAATKPDDVPKEAPKATVAESVIDFYLLLSSDPANEIAPVRLQVIDVNSANFKRGEMLWFNLTENSIGGQLGSEQLAMTPQSRRIVKPPARSDENYNVNLSFRMPGNERLYPLCETKWLHDSRSRTLFFVISQDGSRTPRVLGFPDYREAEDKAQADQR